MHPCHTTHVRIIPQANILVDEGGAAQIAGLGNVSTLSHPTVGTAGGRTSTDRLPREHTPELAWPGISVDLTDPPHSTTADDMYAFRLVAWEVRTDCAIRCLIDSFKTGSHGSTTVLWDD